MAVEKEEKELYSGSERALIAVINRDWRAIFTLQNTGATPSMRPLTRAQMFPLATADFWSYTCWAACNYKCRWDRSKSHLLANGVMQSSHTLQFSGSRQHNIACIFSFDTHSSESEQDAAEWQQQ